VLGGISVGRVVCGATVVGVKVIGVFLVSAKEELIILSLTVFTPIPSKPKTAKKAEEYNNTFCLIFFDPLDLLTGEISRWSPCPGQYSFR